MSPLDRKLLREMRRIWAQALAIAMVMACGVATIVLALGAYRSLDDTRTAFYDRYRFASVFATMVRAPEHLKSSIAAIPGVSSLEARIQKPVILDIEGMDIPGSAIVISIPDFSSPTVNRLYLRKGRMPDRLRGNEVVITERFSKAHKFEPGDSFNAIFNGKKSSLKIVGIVLSPEFIYALGPGDMVPDDRRFGVFYMSQSHIEALFDMEHAFNSLVITTIRGANLNLVIKKLDQLLLPFGSEGAFSRKDQKSNAFLDSELNQLNAMAKVIPPIFLFVSVFLVNMILSRLVTFEREEIGLLKALGYSNWKVAEYYIKLVVLISSMGLFVGSVAGYWLGRGLTHLYGDFFSFPFLIFRQSFDLYFIAGGITLMAGLLGASKAVWTIVQLPPAVAMRPPAPPKYNILFLNKLQSLRIFSQLTVMAIRHLFRHPLRSSFTTLGTSLSISLLIAALFTYDAIDHMIDVVFFRAENQKATVYFAEEKNTGALIEISRLPGVMRAEPFRQTPIKIRNGHLELRISIIGVPEDIVMGKILDRDLKPMLPTASGLMISERVANKLNVKIGEFVTVELIEKGKQSARVPITGITQSYIGLSAYMRLQALHRLLVEPPQITGAKLLIDQSKQKELYKAIKLTPQIAAIALQDISREKFRVTIEQNITTMTAVYVSLALIITFGVIYNSARIQLSERARELASLRVLGFTRFEVSNVLLIELFTIVFIAQPLGWIIGYGFAWSIVQGFANDLFRVPLIINISTYATASLIVLLAAIASALIVRLRVDKLDLIKVLKTRD